MTLLRALVLLVFVAGAAITVMAGDDTGKSPETVASPAVAAGSAQVAAPASAASSSGACLSDPAVLDDLRKQREVLQIRERDIAAKEAELKAREDAVSEELKKFDAIRKDIAKVQGARTAENEERVNKLVETFETMSPKAASQLLTTLDETLAVSAMSRISTQRLAKIMNLMDAAKASRLTELLAGVVRASKPTPKGRDSTASDGAAETTEKKRGGENT